MIIPSEIVFKDIWHVTLYGGLKGGGMSHFSDYFYTKEAKKTVDWKNRKPWPEAFEDSAKIMPSTLLNKLVGSFKFSLEPSKTKRKHTLADFSDKCIQLTTEGREDFKRWLELFAKPIENVDCWITQTEKAFSWHEFLGHIWPKYDLPEELCRFTGNFTYYPHKGNYLEIQK